ncbi:MAG: class II aldolase/adducin family protein [Clostridia bacterium]|nr:class II aldolase/adducin family protein [Clostridia bacterium]
MEITKAKELVIKAGKEIAAEGLIARTWGNISCRTDENHFVISASGKEYETLTPDEVVEMDIENLAYEGKIKPSSEKKAHREIYKLKEDAGFIIHTHQHNASAVSAMGQYRVKLDREYEGIGDFVLVSEYGLPSTSHVSDKVAEAVYDSIGKAVIMSNHGAICYGKDYDEAFLVARNLEEACGKYLEFIGVEPWDGEEDHFEELWNTSSVVMKYIDVRAKLPAYLDDFAQMVGPELKILSQAEANEEVIAKAVSENKPILVSGKGAMCNAATKSDQIAMSMIIEKNARAALASLGVKPIGRYEAMFMRQFYLQKYSKLKNKNFEEETE